MEHKGHPPPSVPQAPPSNDMITFKFGVYTVDSPVLRDNLTPRITSTSSTGRPRLSGECSSTTALAACTRLEPAVPWALRRTFSTGGWTTAACLRAAIASQHLHEMESQVEAMRNRFIALKALEEEEFHSSRCSRPQKCAWEMLEKPESSRKARVLRLISILAIFATCLLTMTDLVRSDCSALSNGFQVPNPLAIIELVCVGWLTLEYLLRIMSAPKKLKFFAGVLNIIDFLFILQYVFSYLLIEADLKWGFEQGSFIVDLVCNVRILMILKLGRHLKGFQILGQTLRKSSKELGMLLLFLLIGIVTFSSLSFLFEPAHNGNASSALWWATMAMITSNVCGTDVCPKTVFPKMIATACVLCGVVIITLPIPIIINNFGECYKMQKMQEITLKRRSVRQRCKDE